MKIKRLFNRDGYVSQLGCSVTWMKRHHVINALIKKNNYRRYLEIGVRDPADNFDRIEIGNKDGVDPAGNCKYSVTSDVFFEGLDPLVKYDLVFIDGLHLEAQVDRDIANSLKHLNLGGAIVVHDCNPPRFENQVEEYDGKSSWNGTVWKSFAKLRMSEPELNMYVVDTDWGVGVIQRGFQKLFPKTDSLDFDFLQKNRVHLMNLIRPKDFLEMFPS